MSRVEGLDVLLGRLQRFGESLGPNLADLVEEELRITQKEAADLVPVNSGHGRATLLLPEALHRVEREKGKTRLRFGFLTRAMRAKKERGGALYLFWVEFGTKGYRAREMRFAGYDKRGRRRQQRVKRDIPARPAVPFFRPAAANFLRRMASRGHWVDVVVGAKRKAGFR